MTLRVATIIPVHNYPQVGRCIETVLAQDYPEHEILVVDDGSTDETPQLVEGYEGVRLLRKENGGAASARNYGAMHTDADVLFFLDSDTKIGSDCVTQMVTPLAENGIIGMTHGLYGIANKHSLVARLIYLKCLYHFRNLDLMDFAWSYGIAVRRTAFEEIGRFDPYFPGAGSEDVDFAYRMTDAGHAIKLVREAVIFHHFHESLWLHLRRHRRQARWRMMLIRKTARLTDQQIRPREYLNVIVHGLFLASLPLAIETALIPFAMFVFCLCFHVRLTQWSVAESGDWRNATMLLFEFLTICMWVVGAFQGVWGLVQLAREEWKETAP